MATDITLVLGALSFGTRIDEAQSFDLLDQYREAGGEWIDTADNYAWWAHPSGFGGQSETVIGRWLDQRPGARGDVRISTKGGAEPTTPNGYPDHVEGLSASALEEALTGSLERLRTDRVDLYWSHIEDRSVDLGETVRTLDGFVADGRVKRLGASNHPMWRVEQARNIAFDHAIEPYRAIQLRWSYLQPLPGVALPQSGHVHATSETFDYLRGNDDVWLWVYNTLLDGGYTRADRPLPDAYDHPGTRRRLAVLDAVAAETGATRNQVVLSWLAGGPLKISPIVGVTTPAQITEALAARTLTLTPDQRTRLDTAA
ncbi:aryl-alcohol dehydrogenase-like predicted oxidoreductase [Actinoplanes lutulentus]|uniref:Aryl-alcohol dehydrogenase-like predicted oxidoreductase n=1 Tax=Actinoplanes lutulentus TaxID=1287878 RepID=A0A327ZA30_9ACTN|nr:aldo/keto reductase [Actinoplanes lutulentus]MBB2949167.1 aryl-alcohol dehydrogenase-like predicted oxidoreductase [Actinoplanes lutulentus]RAK34651.1 aryl-alcohol dehydrogenase-like predicted oxidoreductase [Actinoplanes lutulentus]